MTHRSSLTTYHSPLIAHHSRSPSVPDLPISTNPRESKNQLFAEENFRLPQYKLRFVRLPIARPGAVYAMQQVQQSYARPEVNDIYTFINTLFNKVREGKEAPRKLPWNLSSHVA